MTDLINDISDNITEKELDVLVEKMVSEALLNNALLALENWDGVSVLEIVEAVEGLIEHKRMEYEIEGHDRHSFNRDICSEVEAELTNVGDGYWPLNLSELCTWYVVGLDQRIIHSRDYSSLDVVVCHYPVLTDYTVVHYTDAEIMEFTSEWLDESQDEDDETVISIRNLHAAADVLGIRDQFKAMIDKHGPVETM